MNSDYKVVIGDIVTFERAYTTVFTGVVLNTKRGFLGEDITVVTSIFPYCEHKLYNSEFQLVEKGLGEKEKFNVGDLVMLRCGGGLLYIDKVYEVVDSGHDVIDYVFSVKKVGNPSNFAHRVVNGYLLKRFYG